MRLITEPVRARVGKGEAAVVVLHYAVLAADVARQSRVGRRVNVASNYFVTRLEQRRRLDLGSRGGAGLDRDRDHILRQSGHHVSLFFASSAMRCPSSAWVTTPFLSRRSSVAWSQCT